MWAYAPLALSKDRENDQTPLHPLVTGCVPSRSQVCTVVVERDVARPDVETEAWFWQAKSKPRADAQHYFRGFSVFQTTTELYQPMKKDARNISPTANYIRKNRYHMYQIFDNNSAHRYALYTCTVALDCGVVDVELPSKFASAHRQIVT